MARVEPAEADRQVDRGRVTSIAPIVVFDTAGPLIVYSLLRSNGSSTVTALLLSGTLPAVGIAAGLIRRRRLDVIGALVLAGIAVGTALGLLGGDSRLVLVEGSVPTAVFGLACLGSLLSDRPLIFRFALEFYGPDTRRGRDFAGRWRHKSFRHAFRVITAVWGLAFLTEAAARAIIADTASTDTALTISRVLPYLVTALLIAWMTAYGQRVRRRRSAAALEGETS